MIGACETGGQLVSRVSRLVCVCVCVCVCATRAACVPVRPSISVERESVGVLMCCRCRRNVSDCGASLSLLCLVRSVPIRSAAYGCGRQRRELDAELREEV
jgi:hypothetical protein